MKDNPSVTHPAFQTKDQQKVFMMEMLKLLQLINKGTHIEEILQGIFDNFSEFLPYDRIGFATIDPKRETIKATWLKTRYDRVILSKNYELKIKDTSLSKIMESRQARIINDLKKYYKENKHSHSTEAMIKEGIQSSLTCPIIHQGNPIGFIFFSSQKTNSYKDHHIDAFHWITEPLALALERATMYERMVQLNREKNILLGVASHDLRSPIAQIQTMGELLKGKLSEEDRIELGQMLVTRCQGLLTLLNDLLDVSAIEAGRMPLRHETAQIKLLTHQTVQGLLPVANAKNIALNVYIVEDFSVIVDPPRIIQALDNLITNAIKYSNPNSTITVLAEEISDGWKMVVSDEGVGIPASEIPKLFEEFSKTKTTPTAGEKQFGLGLSIVKKIIEAHGGSMSVESKLGEGSTFTITMPASA